MASKDRVQIGQVIVTVATKYEPTFAVTVTEHAVEGGSNIIDHARPQLIKISFEGIKSELDEEVLSRGVKSAYDYLRSLHTTPQVISIQTPTETFPSMLCTNFKPMTSKEIGGSLKFSIEFVEYKVVNTKKQSVEVIQGKKVPKGKPPVIQPEKQQTVRIRNVIGKIGSQIFGKGESQQSRAISKAFNP